MVRKKSVPTKQAGGPLKRKFKKQVDEKRKKCFKKLRRCLRTFKEVKKDQASIFPDPIALARFGKKLLAGAKSLAKEALDIGDLPGVTLRPQSREAAVKLIKAVPVGLAPAPTRGTERIRTEEGRAQLSAEIERRLELQGQIIPPPAPPLGLAAAALPLAAAAALQLEAAPPLPPQLRLEL